MYDDVDAMCYPDDQWNDMLGGLTCIPGCVCKDGLVEKRAFDIIVKERTYF